MDFSGIFSGEDSRSKILNFIFYNLDFESLIFGLNHPKLVLDNGFFYLVFNFGIFFTFIFLSYYYWWYKKLKSSAIKLVLISNLLLFFIASEMIIIPRFIFILSINIFIIYIFLQSKLLWSNTSKLTI